MALVAPWVLLWLAILIVHIDALSITGQLKAEQYRASLVQGEKEGDSSVEESVALFLHRLELSNLLPLFEKHKITSEIHLSLLTNLALDEMEVVLGDKLKLLAAVKELKRQGNHEEEIEHIDADTAAARLGAHFAKVLSPSARQSDRTLDPGVSAAIAKMLEHNNANLLSQVEATVAKNNGDSRQQLAPRELSADDNGAQRRALNADTATLWLEDNAAKVVLGTDADTSLYRAAPGVLSTAGAFQVGTATQEGVCSEAADQGILRWFDEKAVLQVCNGEEWKTAGGAVLDAADNEPCASDENPGALQFDAAASRLDVCDAQAATWTRVLVNGQRGVAASLGPTSAMSLEVTTGAGGVPEGGAGPHGNLRVGASDSTGESNPERFWQVTAYDSDGVIRMNPGKESTMYVNREVGVPRDFHVWDGESTPVFSVVAQKVGIGTASPAQNLEVFDSDGTSTLRVNAAFLGNSAPCVAKLMLSTAAGTGNAVAEVSADGNTGQVKMGGSATNYFPVFLAGGQEKMRITTAGLVGVGTDSPSRMLHVAGQAKFGGFVQLGTGGTCNSGAGARQDYICR